MNNTNNKTVFIVQGAVIAAMYIALFYLQEFLFPGSATLAIQFRASEALTLLAAITPAAIPGLTVGCFISNILNTGVLPLDLILGTLATFLAAFFTYKLRKIKLFSLPIVSALMPALFNGVIIGFEIAFFLSDGGFNMVGFLTSAATVAIGELAVCFVLGLPLYKIINKIKVFK